MALPATHCFSRRTTLAALGLVAFSASAIAAPTLAIVTEPVGGERLARLAPQIDAWKKAQLVSSVKLLKAQPNQKDAGFATLAIVTLPSDKAFKTWSAEVQAQVGPGVIVRQADLVKHEGTPSATPAKAVHVASLYATHVPAADYKAYTGSYITPNMNLQRASGIMSQYAMYLERDPVDGKVRSLLVMEYVNEAAYAQREQVKAAGKAKLTANADWARINARKESIRTDISSTASTEVGAP